jgi:hypothetical protein
MTRDTANVLIGEGWRDGLETSVRGQIRGLIEAMLEEELANALGRARYARARAAERLGCEASESATGESGSDVLPVGGYRNGHRHRQLVGTFGRRSRSRAPGWLAPTGKRANGGAKRCRLIAAARTRSMR